MQRAPAEAGENKVPFTNYFKQMKVIRRLRVSSERSRAASRAKIRASRWMHEMHEACGFAYTILRRDGDTCGPFVYRGEGVAYVLLVNILNEERRMRKYMVDKKPLVMTHEDGQKHTRPTVTFATKAS